MLCNVCNNNFSASDLLSLEGKKVCAECKPEFLQRVREGVVDADNFVYGTFGGRFGGAFIDGIIQQVAQILITLIIVGSAFAAADGQSVAPLVASLIGMFLSLSYEIVMNKVFGATLGKMAIGLRVVREDGSAISWGQAVGRSFAKILSGLILCIGYLIMLNHPRKQTLHDRLCGTIVVKK